MNSTGLMLSIESVPCDGFVRKVLVYILLVDLFLYVIIALTISFIR